MSAQKLPLSAPVRRCLLKNILGDVFQRPALKSAHIALMDIDETRLEESAYRGAKADGFRRCEWRN